MEEKIGYEAATLYERARRLPESPAACAVDTATKSATRTWLRSAERTIDATGTYRQATHSTTCSHFPVAPWRWVEVLPHVTIRPYVDGYKKGESTDAEAQSSTEAALALLPRADLHAYTDGSARNGVGGAGVVVYRDGHTQPARTHCVGAGRRSIAYTAELVAIKTALPLMQEELNTSNTHNTVVLLTDSQSALRALEAGPVRAPGLLHEVWEALAEITRHSTKVILHYVPGHVQVQGNAAADVLAKRATAKGYPQEEPVTLLASKAAIRTVCAAYTPTPSEDTLYGKATTDTRQRDSQPPLLTPTLTRQGAVQMRLLRTRRHPALFDYMRTNDVAKCKHCGVNATLVHIFQRCTATRELRNKILPERSLKHLLLLQPEVCLEYITNAKLTEASLADLVRSTDA